MNLPGQRGADAAETQLIQLMSTCRDAGTGRTMLDLMLGLMLATSLFYFFAAPSSCLGIAFALFTAAAVIGDRTAPSQS